MKGIMKKFCIIILISIASIVAWYVVPLPLYQIYYGSYEHNPWYVDGCRRLPLWYPYEIVEEYDSFEDSDSQKHIRLINREASQGSLVDEQLHSGEYSLEEEVLLRTNDILSFNSSSNVVWGKRALFQRKRVDGGKIQKRYVGEKYFILAADTGGVLYFKDADAYEQKCRQYHLLPSDLKSYDEKYAEFKRNNDAKLLEVLCFSLKELPASGAIWILLGIGLWGCACVSGIRALLSSTPGNKAENVGGKGQACF